MAYVPESTKAVFRNLRHGRGHFVIDDFEDRNLWSESFNDLWKKSKKGKARVGLSIDPSQGANGTSSSMKIGYKLGERAAVTVRIGGGRKQRYLEVENDPSSAYDLTRFKKISLFFMFSSFQGDGGSKGSNVIWIDEIELQ
jgi:hypothetical protein